MRDRRDRTEKPFNSMLAFDLLDLVHARTGVESDGKRAAGGRREDDGGSDVERFDRPPFLVGLERSIMG